MSLARLIVARYPKIPKRHAASLARTFLAAGMAVVDAQFGSLERAASAMQYHRRLLTVSRLRVAKCSHAEVGVHQSRQFKRVHSIAARHWSRLSKFPNVIGFAPGFRTINGIRTPERCVSILVSRKLSKDALRRWNQAVLPKTLHHAGDTARVDVVEVGSFRLYASPSDRIAPESDPPRSATLGIFATDHKTGATLALTAMHAAGALTQYPPPDGGAPGSIAFLDQSGDQPVVLGELLRGTRGNGIDAAAIQLDAGARPSRTIPNVGEVQYWRVLNTDADINTSVTMCGAESGGPVHGVIANPCVYIPQYGLGPAIQVSIAAQPGDSGAPLVDRDNFLLGLLVGGGEKTQFFSPIGNILNTLSCDLY